jgi:uncharacterized protein (DUF1501 family)
MLTFHAANQHQLCDRISRRSFLRLGALGVAGLTLADVLRLRAHAHEPSARSARSVIMVILEGGPSHLDLYDPKPDAPVEYRGEFKPIATKVPGIQVSEMLPLQASIADKFAILRNMQFRQQGHTPPELLTGFLDEKRPDIGAAVSKLRADARQLGSLPPYVSFHGRAYPGFLGTAHRPFVPGEKDGLQSLALHREVPLDRLSSRRDLLRTFETLQRDIDDARGSLAGLDAFTGQALEMITTPKARDAFDVSREPEKVRSRYGKATQYLQALRLAEAGVPVVTITPPNPDASSNPKCNGQWDHHDFIFDCLRRILPLYDRAVHAFLTDLHERGLDKDVAVVIWGEMGRTPRVGTQKGTTAGRDHWPQSGFALMAGGGFRTGQVIGATDPRGELPKGQPYTPQNVLATLYRHLGIDPATTLPDHTGRPMYLLDDREPVRELL